MLTGGWFGAGVQSGTDDGSGRSGLGRKPTLAGEVRTVVACSYFDTGQAVGDRSVAAPG